MHTVVAQLDPRQPLEDLARPFMRHLAEQFRRRSLQIILLALRRNPQRPVKGVVPPPAMLAVKIGPFDLNLAMPAFHRLGIQLFLPF
jgi:hypothetical protein